MKNKCPPLVCACVFPIRVPFPARIAQAVQLAEVYWMSLTRDVPFSKYGEHNDTIIAAGEPIILQHKTAVSLKPDNSN